MVVSKKGNEKVEKIIKKSVIDPEANFRLSLFSYLYEKNGRYMIYNTFSFEAIELSEHEWSALQKLNKAPQNYEFITDNCLEQLVLSRYIVESDHNEIKQYQQTVFLLKTMAGRKKGFESYTIFPTTGCNARCIYCYEEGFAVKTMTTEKADRLIQFICETRHDGVIKLRWFGGEPLSCAGLISYICRQLQERGVTYKSSMVTNASLMTKELAKEARELWNLKQVQVSLDGAKEDYNKRKNYYDQNKFNYDVVMKAVHYFADEGIEVLLRVNVDFDNIRRIPVFLENIKSEFGDMTNISLYIVPLYQARNDENCLQLFKEINHLTDIQKQMGISASKKLNIRISNLKLNYCMADSLDKSVVITPDGYFNNCEHLPESNSWGNIFDSITDKEKFEKLRTPSEIDEKCKKCPFLPECTPFYKNGCPGWFEKCYEYHCIKTEYMLDDLLTGEVTEEKNYDEEI